MRVNLRNKEQHELTSLVCCQVVQHAHKGPVWVLEFSPDGRYLATGGHDGVVCVWKVRERREVRRRERGGENGGIDGEKGGIDGEVTFRSDLLSQPSKLDKQQKQGKLKRDREIEEEEVSIHGVAVSGPGLLDPSPFKVFSQHTGDISSLSWSHTGFLLSSSTDRTVRLWHLSQSDCVCVFQHSDYVTSVEFHPTNDSLFVSGTLDHFVRVWDIPKGVVVHGAHAPSMVTTVAFSLSGHNVVAGLYTGNCIFYEVEANTQALRFHTQIECRAKSARKGKKVTSLAFVELAGPFNKDQTCVSAELEQEFAISQEKSALHTQGVVQAYLLVTTMDSRLRLYKLDDFSLVCRYKGGGNSSGAPIGARISGDTRHILMGTQDKSVVLWRLRNDMVNRRRYSVSAVVNNIYESFFATNVGAVCDAVLAPKSTLDLVGSTNPFEDYTDYTRKGLGGAFIVTSSETGNVCVFENRAHY